MTCFWQKRLGVTDRTGLLTATFAALSLALILSTGCADPDGVDRQDNTGDDGGKSVVGADAIAGLDAQDAGSQSRSGCGSNGACASQFAQIPACKVAVCVSGTCALASLDDGVSCDDGDPCTLATTCLGGGCGNGTKLACDDDNPCTDDACGLPNGCTFSNNHAVCSAGTGSSGCGVGVCGLGVCSGTSRFGSSLWSGRRVRAMIADSGGWVVAMQAAAESRWGRVDIGGERYQDLPLPLTHVDAMTRTATADFVFAGTDRTQLPNGEIVRRGGMVRVATDGALRWRRTYARKGADRLNAVAALADDTVVACGRAAQVAGTGDMWFIRGSAPTGFPLLDYVYGSADEERCNSIIALPGGDLLLLGTQSAAPKQNQPERGQALALRITAKAALVWNRTWGGGGHDEIFAAARRTDGSIWLAGTCGAPPNATPLNAAPQGCVWLLSAGGKVQLTRIVQQPGLSAGGAVVAPVASRLFAIAVQLNHSFVVVGEARSSAAGPWRGFAAWRDPWANPVAARYASSSAGWLRAAAVDAAGTVALAGAVSTTDAAAILLRAPATGVPCIGSAPCAGKPLDACDDGDPCTADWCAAVCRHAPLAEAAPCGVAASCVSGQCVPTAP